jgi:hypothetical protein
MSTDRHRDGRAACPPASVAAKEHDMILVIILGILALFSLISILLDSDEPRRSNDEHATYDWYLMRFGAR